MTSTVSAAHIQAVQLEQADVRPGMRVLEIGSGGYNAALLATMVGQTGEVTTIDIDPEIIDRARACLDAAGFGHVRTIVGDGDTGVPDHGPFDRIVVTVRAWDIPPAWVEQLTPDGRLVVPLRVRGMTRTVALDRCTRLAGGSDGAILSGGDARLCAFVPMQGAGAQDDQIALIPEDAVGGQSGPGRVQLRTDMLGTDALAAAAAGVRDAINGPLRLDPVQRWTDVDFDHVDDLDLWLGLRLPSFAILTADREIIDTGRPSALTRAGAPALVTPSGFAHRTKRPSAATAALPLDQQRFDTGVTAWAATTDDAARLADTYADAIRGWGAFRAAGGTSPRLDVYPAGTPVEQTRDMRVVDKPRCRLVFSWPTPTSTRPTSTTTTSSA
jgi:protein-L-isoaspartate(D-aspartate) O-methyltransferase